MTNTYMGQKVIAQTTIFGRDYFWMQDGDGVTYLVKAKKAKAKSVNGQTGEATEFVENLVPDFS